MLNVADGITVAEADVSSIQNIWAQKAALSSLLSANHFQKPKTAVTPLSSGWADRKVNSTRPLWWAPDINNTQSKKIKHQEPRGGVAFALCYASQSRMIHNT